MAEAEHSAIAEESEGGTFQKLQSPLNNGDDVVYMNGKRVLVAKPLTVVRALTSTGGARVQAAPPARSEIGSSRALQIQVKEEPVDEAVPEPHRRRSMHLFDEFLKNTNTKVASVEESLKSMDVELPIQTAQEAADEVKVPSEAAGEPFVEPPTQEPMEGVVGGSVRVAVKEEPVEEPSVQPMAGVIIDVEKVCAKEEELVEEPSIQPMEGVIDAKKEEPVEEQSVQLMEGVIDVEKVCAKKEEPVEEQLVQPMEGVIDVDMFCAKKEAVKGEVKVVKKEVKKEVVEERRIPNLEDGEFPEEPGWSLLGRKVEVATSTARGVQRLVDNEIVHFTYSNYSYKNQWIVRISTKRSGEVGRLPMEWAKTVIPLLRSGNVKVQGRCIAAPHNLQMMQEIMLLVSFYVHRSVFAECVDTSWKLEACGNIDTTAYPLFTLLKMLEIKPYRKADFTPDDIDTRKRLLYRKLDADEVAALPLSKRRKGAEPVPDQAEDEQALSESALNKIIGAAEIFDLEEMKAPSTLTCELKPYQSQALFWMSEIEKGIDIANAESNLHPCWSAYNICDGWTIYVNIFTGEATNKFPKATQMARGGILADAMGLGKTVMTIALILSNPGWGRSASLNGNITNKRRNVSISDNVQGGTLIVCPMALLGQWKDELETHSAKRSISIFVHYGGGRTNSAELISEYDVVLTTYGVLSASFRSDREHSIYHKIQWYRVVLDEAHHIKAHKSQVAQATFALSSHCRWCLTGTPIQNSLEDLFSLLHFLGAEPWCSWAWWQKLVQRPYEMNDPRALKLVKGILRTLMLRRTKETKDKHGSPILVLPPTDIKLIECEQSESERDFYDALFLRSKVQFDQYLAQGKVLNHYANILDLLMQLRRCCNHPFLVLCGSNPQKYADLGRLARKFLQSNTESSDTYAPSDPQKNAELNKLATTFLQNCDSSSNSVQSRGYIDEVLEHIQNGETVECSICMDSPDDPVFTPCAHKFCRECLFNCWGNSAEGTCPICRQLLQKNDLITCPSESPFKVDIENNMTESSKVSKLLKYLEHIETATDEKSIVFSQWTSFLDLLENPLRSRGIGYLRFHGKLTQKQREKVLDEFNKTSEKRVLLMSLKAGGVGLNLTAASNVFLMDPWWNPAVEEQAIMRIHRIGQKRKVIVRRFIVKDTVEDRLQQVQDRKQRMISGALTDDEVRSARIHDLKMLFS